MVCLCNHISSPPTAVIQHFLDKGIQNYAKCQWATPQAMESSCIDILYDDLYNNRITFSCISHIIFLWYPRMSVVPFPAESQCLLPGISWAASASTSLSSVMDNWWAPVSHWKFLLLVSMLTTLHDFALSTIKCHFMSITPNQQSHLNSFHMIIWSSSVLTIPPKFLSSHTAPGHTPRPCTQLRAWSRGSNATHFPPSWWLSLNTSFHSDNFICMQWLYLFFGQVLFHLSILALNHHLHFKP